ncbi:MAG: sugar phosphate isomerase/epimerase family protein [Clostridia bacterium]
MKFGYCANMLSTETNAIGYEWIPMLKRIGFDYVELPLAQMMTFGEKAFQTHVVAELNACGLPCLCCNNFFPASYRLTGDEADHESALAYANAALSRAASLGVRNVVFGSSGARNMPYGYAKERALDQLAELLRSLGDIAQNYGITLVLEPLNPSESNLLNWLSECRALARKVAHPAVELLVDSFHLRLSGEPLFHVLDAGEHLRHIHLARTLGRGLPCIGDGEPWDEWFSLLRQGGYEGAISIEAYAPAMEREKQIADALHYLHSLARG